MSTMPLARIYASLVEEAEPLRADLLARGYNVEVVFPDAQLTASADLELRLEHCSPEQAIARVEADSGSPSRCVFLTTSKTRQHDLILIEMTVKATGTESRHPLYLPVNLPIANPNATEQSAKKSETLSAAARAAILPFPLADVKIPRPIVPDFVPDFTPDFIPVPTVSAPAASAVAELKTNLPEINPPTTSADWGKLVGAEVTAFLAKTPRTEQGEYFSTKVLNNIRASKSVNQVRTHWEGLTLLGVAASFLLLLYIGWQAGSARPWQPAVGVMLASASSAPLVARVDIPKATVATLTPRAAAKSLVQKSSLVAPRSKFAVLRHRFVPRESLPADNLVARDVVVRVASPARKHVPRPIPARPVAAARKAPLPQTASVASNPVRLMSHVQPPAAKTHPIKKISDLK